MLHVVTTGGLSQAYPDTWGEAVGSSVAELMDTARGGQFVHVPEKHPASAIFCYYDPSCVYSCQVWCVDVCVYTYGYIDI